jgi:II/X family phage/plasmid replication protein
MDSKYKPMVNSNQIISIGNDMIDLLHIRIDIPHKPFGNTRIKVAEADGNEKETRYSTTANAYENGAPFIVTSMDSGKAVEIRCSPLKVLQGHNVFGTDKVKSLGYRIICIALKKQNIAVTEAQKEQWRAGEFEIKELHITYRFKVQSYATIGRVLTHLLRNTDLSFQPATMKAGNGIKLTAKHKLAEWSLYDKLLEFNDKRRHEGKYLNALVDNAKLVQRIEKNIRTSARNSIRVELKLLSKYLVKHELNTGTAWDLQKVKGVYFKELALLRLGTIKSIEHADILLDKIEDKKLRLTFLAWLKGEKLSNYHERQTLDSRCKEIQKAIGINIKQDVVPVDGPPLDIFELFNRRNKLKNFPDWAKKYPAIAFKVPTDR